MLLKNLFLKSTSICYFELLFSLIVFDLSFEEFDFIFDGGCCRLVMTSFRNESRIVPFCYIFMWLFFISSDSDTKSLQMPATTIC